MKAYKKMMALGIVILTIAICAPLVAAQSGSVKITTPLTHIEINPGKEVSLKVNVRNLGTEYETINLEVVAPEGWQAALKNSGYVVQTVYLGPGENQTLDLLTSYPEDLAIGSYQIEIRATDSAGSSLDTLIITVDVTTESAIGTSGITVKSLSPNLVGQAGTEFSFQVRVANNTDEERLINLVAITPADDWTVTFSPRYQSTVISATDVNARDTTTLDVKVKPPTGIDAGEYPVSIAVSSGTYEDQNSVLIDITGTYTIDVTTSDGVLSLTAAQGQQATVSLLIQNTGTAQLTNASFSTSTLPGWIITFDPTTVSSIPAGEYAQVNALITPPSDAIPGDYKLTVRVAAEPHYPSSTVDLRITVLGSTLWGIVGFLIIGLVVAVILVMFWRLGRR